LKLDEFAKMYGSDYVSISHLVSYLHDEPKEQHLNVFGGFEPTFGYVRSRMVCAEEWAQW
jgi:hypothetical protein